MALVLKVASHVVILLTAIDHLTGDGDNGWFGIYMGLSFLSGLWAMAVLAQITSTSSDRIGARGTKAGYSLYLLIEPVIPFLWPAVISLWFNRDVAANDPPKPRIHENLPISESGR